MSTSRHIPLLVAPLGLSSGPGPTSLRPFAALIVELACAHGAMGPNARSASPTGRSDAVPGARSAGGALSPTCWPNQHRLRSRLARVGAHGGPLPLPWCATGVPTRPVVHGQGCYNRLRRSPSSTHPSSARARLGAGPGPVFQLQAVDLETWLSAVMA
jgi:hypothetical protein